MLTICTSATTDIEYMKLSLVPECLLSQYSLMYGSWERPESDKITIEGKTYFKKDFKNSREYHKHISNILTQFMRNENSKN